MKKTLFPIIAFIFCSCTNMFDAGNNKKPGFQDELYILNGDTIIVHRSLDYISITPAHDLDIDELNELVQSYNLEPVALFNHSPLGKIVEYHYRYDLPVVLKVPRGASVQDFYSSSSTASGNNFGNHPLIQYSLPVYTRSPDKENWYYVTGKVSISTYD